jgi:hypothetical protein
MVRKPAICRLPFFCNFGCQKLRKMKNDSDLVKVFTGSEVSGILLKAELEDIGIPALIKNDFQTGISAGFAGGIPYMIDLYINESDRKKADPVIKEFKQNNQ